MSDLSIAHTVRPLSAPDRLIRSTAAALVCVAISAAGHHSAGGALDPLAVVAVFLGAGAIAWLLTARRVTTGQMFGLLMLCQLVVHLAAPIEEMSMGPGMLSAHVVATAVSVAVLARGDSFVWSLAERLGWRSAPLLAWSPRPVWGCLEAPIEVTRSRCDVSRAHSRSLRGPPFGSA